MILSVIIPAYNEEQTILPIIKRVESVILPQNVEKEIIVVDDGSTDGTTAKLKGLPASPHLKIFFHEKNQGKTAAVKLGIEKATGNFILIQDADLEYDPEHYPALLDPLLRGKASVVYGSRFLGKIENMAFVNRFANKISNLTINALYGASITDFHTGYKLFKQEILKALPITSKNFTFDTEITARVLKKKIPIYEIPINYVARENKEGKKITWGLALETYLFLLKFRFSAQ